MSDSFGRVGVLYGGISAEREVSLLSGTGVCEALRAEGVDAHLFDTGKQDLTALAAAGFDRVFIALHGCYGEDGTVQGALELLGLPYTGSGPTASGVAMDKIMTKRLWLHHGLPTPGFETLSEAPDPAALAEALGLPLIMKPPLEGSTVGVSRVDEAGQVRRAYDEARRFGDVVLAERYIRGRELTVPILGSGAAARALPIIEIIAPGGNYDYEHKYFSDETRYVCPAELDEALARRIQDISVRAYRVLGCEGWGRADLMLDAAGEPWLLEMNTSPGMTGHSLVPMGAKAAGISYGRLCVEILASARCKLRRPAAT